MSVHGRTGALMLSRRPRQPCASAPSGARRHQMDTQSQRRPVEPGADTLTEPARHHPAPAMDQEANKGASVKLGGHAEHRDEEGGAGLPGSTLNRPQPARRKKTLDGSPLWGWEKNAVKSFAVFASPS